MWSLPRYRGETTFACITKRLKDGNIFSIGTSHENPILDTRVYGVEYADGYKDSMSSNSITMNLFAQVDAEVNRHALSDGISDLRTNSKEIKQQYTFITDKNGIRRRQETPAGW